MARIGLYPGVKSTYELPEMAIFYSTCDGLTDALVQPGHWQPSGCQMLMYVNGLTKRRGATAIHIICCPTMFSP